MNYPPVERVAVLGAGTIGVEIAALCAAWEIDTRLHDISADAMRLAPRRLNGVLEEMAADGALAAAAVARAAERVVCTTDAARAADRADIVIECVTERAEVKRDALARIEATAPTDALLVTTSSYLLPSVLTRGLQLPERFAAFHFHSPPWRANVVDVMAHRRTAPECVERLVAFGRQLGQTPIVLRREFHGYVFNSMLRQLLSSALALAERGVADFHDIDRAWMGVTRMSVGPFGILDRIGLDTVREIITQWARLLGDVQTQRNAELLTRWIDQGRLGRKSGHGFYDYPHPEFQQPGFVAPLPRAPAKTPPRISPEAPTDGMRRYVLAARRLPAIAPGAELAPQGTVWLLGDNGVADGLAARWEASARVVRVPHDLTSDEFDRWLTAAQASQPPTHVALLPAFDVAADNTVAWDERRRRCLELPMKICRSWITRLRGNVPQQGPAGRRHSLLAATRLGGDGGAGRRIAIPESTALAALLKGMFLETRAAGNVEPAVRAVDFDLSADVEQVVDCLHAEWADAQHADEQHDDRPSSVAAYRNIERGYQRGYRLAPCTEPATLGNARRSTATITPGSHWLITGGARGVTAIVARRLATEYQLTLHLVGASKFPEMPYETYSDGDVAALKRDVMIAARQRGEKPNDAWQRIERQIEIRRNWQQLADLGIAAHYHACDLGDASAVAQLVAQIRAQHAPVRGLLHGAGVEITGRMDRKPWEVVEATWRGKLDGAVYLLEALAHEPLEAVVAFGSLSGRFGGMGQADYAMANNALARIVTAYSSSPRGVPAVTIDWPAWDEVGMAARPASRRALVAAGHQFLPTAAGGQIVLDELAAGLPETEILVMDPSFLPEGFLATDAELPRTQGENGAAEQPGNLHHQSV